MLPRTRPQILRKIVIPVRSKTTIPIVIFSVLVFILIAFLQHKQVAGLSSAGQNEPSDMPAGASFSRSSVGSNGSQAHGQWISCHEDSTRETDWCQITDQNGAVLYKGDFLPVGSILRVPQAGLKIARFDPANGWVAGPAESLPVPVIPLQDGTLLVPANDTMDLAARWKLDPTERTRVTPGA